MSSLATASFLHEDLADPDLALVPVAVPPLAPLGADASGAVGELPPPSPRSAAAPTLSSGMTPSAAHSSSRNHVSLGMFTFIIVRAASGLRLRPPDCAATYDYVSSNIIFGLGFA